MPSALLKVPHFQQSRDGACLPACACMLLAYWQDPVPENKVSELFVMTEIGVPASRVLRLESWGYDVIYRSMTLEELRDWLAQNIPPIVLVQTAFLDYWTVDTPHAVVLVGMDDAHVYLNDPAFPDAPQTTSLDGFLAGWTEMGEITAVIQTK